MRSIARQLALIAVAVCFALILHAYGDRSVVAVQERTPVHVTRIYTGSDGQTHAEQVDVKLIPVAGVFARSREESLTTHVIGSRFARFAPGFVQEWHPAPARRYVVTLSGQGEVEVAGGQKVRLDPGHVLQAEDVTGKGHITRTIGNTDWVALFVQFGQ